jgi:integrase
MPTLREFWPRFIKGHCIANRHKPSGVERKECAYRTWLDERLGSKKLDAIGPSDIVALKADLANLAAKSANNVLTTLSACLKFAGPDGLKRSEGLGIIEKVPRVRLLPIDSDDTPEWYEVHDYRRIIEGAAKVDASTHLLVLLAGSAGLRRGEIIALKWTDLDIKRRIIHVQRSIWCADGGKLHETVPKGGKGRDVDMTTELADALTRHRNLRERVVTQENGKELTPKIVRMWFTRAQRAAGIEATGAIHRLRHTFCSMLATLGATPKAIQTLAGHASIATTMRYMHLSPSNRAAAIGLLDAAWGLPRLGEPIGERVTYP